MHTIILVADKFWHWVGTGIRNRFGTGEISVPELNFSHHLGTVLSPQLGVEPGLVKSGNRLYGTATRYLSHYKEPPSRVKIDFNYVGNYLDPQHAEYDKSYEFLRKVSMLSSRSNTSSAKGPPSDFKRINTPARPLLPIR